MTVRPEVVVARLAELTVVLAQLARLAKFSAVEREADRDHRLVEEDRRIANLIGWRTAEQKEAACPR